MSYNGIGLQSAKGSSTSGHIQSSLAKNEGDKFKNYSKRKQDLVKVGKQAGKKGVPVLDKSIVEHLSKRDIEVKVSELRDRLEEDDGLDDVQIDARCGQLREKLLKHLDASKKYKTMYKPRNQRLEQDGSS